MKKHFYFLLLFLLPYAVFSQANSNFLNQLDKNFNDYYKLERENIHVHFSKSTYFTNEKIWLSGYVFTQQTKLPSIHTNNVFLEILDSQGSLASRHLLFSTNGVFQATLSIDKTMLSGTYYFRFYTHYMNNFQENLSSVYPIEIINYTDRDYDANKSNKYADLFIEMFPEAGALSLSDSNNIAVKVTNYLGEGVATKTGKVFDKQNNLISTFSTNNYGYGKFEIKNPENTTYRVEVENHGFTYKQELNFIATNDLSLAVDSYSFADKTTISIKNINRSLSKNYYLLLSQNNKILAYPIEKDKPSFAINNQILFDGVNTARIIDDHNNVFATRLFYIHKESIGSNNKDEVAIYSYSAFSINTKVIPKSNIYNSIYINPYTHESSPYDWSYFNAPNRIKKYELDMFLMFQKPKEIFANITSANHPVLQYAFERGIDIQGKINQDIKVKKDDRIRMLSYPDLHEFSKISENNEFNFDHLVVADSIKVLFSLLSKNDKPKDLTLYPKIIGTHRKYIKNISLPTVREGKNRIEAIENQEEILFPTSKYNIVLDDVEIKGSTLKREKQNPMLRGFKASEVIGYESMRVTDFLRQYRFEIEDNLGTTIIYSSKSGSNRMGRGNTMPVIFIDGTQQFDHFLVNQLWMSHVDEIYFDRTYTITGMNNNFMDSNVGMMGIIKIYTKSPGEILRKKETHKAFQITGGFTRFFDFENDVFEENDPGFDYYGNIFWASRVNSKKDNLKYKIPKQNKQKVKVFVEGITSDGTIFSKVEEISSN